MKAISDGESLLEGGMLGIEAGVGEGLSAGVWGPRMARKLSEYEHKPGPVAKQMATLLWAQWTQEPDIYIVHAVCIAMGANLVMELRPNAKCWCLLQGLCTHSEAPSPGYEHRDSTEEDLGPTATSKSWRPQSQAADEGIPHRCWDERPR